MRRCRRDATCVKAVKKTRTSAMKSFIALLVLVAAVNGQKFGPKGRLVDFEVNDCYSGQVTFVADVSNLCWYWECKQDKDGIFALIPRRCALGSRMRSTYQTGKDNPCQINFNKEINFDCTRTADQATEDFVPSCFDELDCKNNGTAEYSGSVCWCDCPPEWQGANDCSKPTVAVDLEATGGKDEENCFYGKDAPCSQANGCENNGTCHNTCKDFWCDCPVPFTRGKRCEKFDCESNQCQNGGTCNRGEGDQDEVNECICQQGYTGLLCEIEGEVEFEVVETQSAVETEEIADPVQIAEVEEVASTNDTITEA